MRVFLVVNLAIVLAVAHATDQPDKECPPTYVDCFCLYRDKEYTYQLYIDTAPIVDIATGKQRCVAKDDPVLLCEMQKCSIFPNDNFDSLFANGVKLPMSNDIEDFDSEEERNLFWMKNFKGGAKRDSPLSYPIEYIVRRSDSNVLSRKKRSAACSMPDLKKMYLKCWKWEYFQSCDGLCANGYAFDIGAGRSMSSFKLTCKNRENRWKPYTLRDCQPYLNCKTKLTAPGNLSCKESGDMPPYCDISCVDYDDKPAVELRRIHCDQDLSQKLPHCAKVDPRANAFLVAPPSDV